MSFAITAVGTVEQVRAQLEKQHDDLAQQQGDNSQYERVYQMVMAELADWPESADPSKVLGLHVEASGHHDRWARNATVTIRPVWFPKVER